MIGWILLPYAYAYAYALGGSPRIYVSKRFTISSFLLFTFFNFSGTSSGRYTFHANTRRGVRYNQSHFQMFFYRSLILTYSVSMPFPSLKGKTVKGMENLYHTTMIRRPKRPCLSNEQKCHMLQSFDI